MKLENHAIYNTEGRKICEITYDKYHDWEVRTGDENSLTNLHLFKGGGYRHDEKPFCEDVKKDAVLNFRIADVPPLLLKEKTPYIVEYAPDEFENTPIFNASGRVIATIGFVDGFWYVDLYGEHYETTLYLNEDGTFDQLERRIEVALEDYCL